MAIRKPSTGRRASRTRKKPFPQNQQHGQAFLGVQLPMTATTTPPWRVQTGASRQSRRTGRSASCDTIVSLNGQEVGSAHDLTDIVGDMQPGEEVRLQIARRQNVNAQVRLGHRDNDDVRQASFLDRDRRNNSDDESSDDDSDRSSRRNDRQKDNSDNSRDSDRRDDDNNDSND